LSGQAATSIFFATTSSLPATQGRRYALIGLLLITFPLEDSMSNEGAAQKIGTIHPLNHAAYERVYNGALFPNSTEYRRTDGSAGPMFTVPGDLLKKLTPKTIVSVGAGSGAYDAALLEFADLAVDEYIVIEPNPHQVKMATRNLDIPQIKKLTIIEQAFGEIFASPQLREKSVDFVMFAHSLYFIDRPGAVVQHALGFLRAGGLLLVQQQAHDTPISRGYRYFNELFGVEWHEKVLRQNHLITNKTIEKELTVLGISSRAFSKPAQFLVDSFFNGDEENASLLLCFMLNSEAKETPEAFQEAWKAWIRFNSSLNPITGHYELPHFQGFVVVENVS
jgi:SAM-dependent methyltransferase